MLAATPIATGRDLMIITATSSGNTFCEQAATIHDIESTIPTISPLINLNSDQVYSAEKLSINTTTLHSNSHIANPGLRAYIS